LPTANHARRTQAHSVPREELLHDNIFYAHAIFQILVDEGLDLVNLDNIKEIWLQLLSVVAILCGCTSEPSFFLSTLDWLLDNLRTAFGEAPDLSTVLADLR
jgi:hypothetical protein